MRLKHLLLICLLGLGSAAQAGMVIGSGAAVGGGAITLVGSATTGVLSGGTENDLIAANVVVGSGTNRALVATVSMRQGNGIATMTRDGQSFTQVANTELAAESYHVEIWCLANPNTSTASVVGVQVTGGTAEAVISVTQWTGVNQTTPCHRGNTASGASATPAVTVSSVASGEVSVDVTSTNVGTINVTAGQTLITNTASGGGGTNRQTSSYDATSTGSVSMNWNSDSADWTMAAMALNPA